MMTSVVTWKSDYKGHYTLYHTLAKASEHAIGEMTPKYCV